MTIKEVSENIIFRRIRLDTMSRLSYKIERYEEAIKIGKLTWTKKGEIL